MDEKKESKQKVGCWVALCGKGRYFSLQNGRIKRKVLSSIKKFGNLRNSEWVFSFLISIEILSSFLMSTEILSRSYGELPHHMRPLNGLIMQTMIICAKDLQQTKRKMEIKPCCTLPLFCVCPIYISSFTFDQLLRLSYIIHSTASNHL